VSDQDRAPGRLGGRVAIISGAARGQGEAEARLFAAQGAKVLLGDVRDGLAKEVANDIGPSALAVHLDVSSPASWQEALETCQAQFGSPTILINNAGVLPVASIDDTDEATMRLAMDVNLMGAFLGIRAVMGPMAQAGGGSIVNVSSINGFKAGLGLTAYTTSKFALRGLTRSAALELGHRGIRVNSLHPGPIDTLMINNPELRAVRGIEPGVNPLAGRAIPRLGTSAEMANLALFLASDESSFSTGSEFVADGGALL
jgi:3alpha(or 20beta)-hydroxysteroid dehydrogenase